MSGLAAVPALFPELRAANSVRVGMIPDAGATQVSVEEKAPLRNYLAGAIGRPVDLVIPTNYNATVEGLGNGSLDFAYLGALTYVKAHERYGVIPMIQRVADQHFHSLFITQTNSSIHKLGDLHGKSFAFGDINSTSGHLIPYAEMKQAGIDVNRDLKFRYTGSHAATAKAVEAGATDAGALDETVFRAMVSDGKVDGSKVRVFYTSEPFVDYVWVARRDLDSGAREKFAGAFLALKKGKNDAILEILRGQEFVRANDAEYAKIRKTAQDLALL
jgi:phosphonate transport system substrate-binding protein